MSLDSESQDELRSRVPTDGDWRAIAQMVSDLPPLPHVAIQAMRLMENPHVTTSQISELISHDTALAARLLKISNSAMFARRAKITTLSQAILMVGFKTLKGIILAATLRGMNRQESAMEGLVWQNSVCTAVCASHICRVLKFKFGEECFTWGLLHDLGKVVLIAQIPKSYAAVTDLTKNGKTYCEAENEILGYSHALVGAMVAKKWNFPQEICQVVLHHHDPLDPPFSDDIMLRTAVIQAADLVAHILTTSHEPGYPDTKPDAIEKLLKLGVGDNQVASVIDQCQQIIAERINIQDPV